MSLNGYVIHLEKLWSGLCEQNIFRTLLIVSPITSSQLILILLIVLVQLFMQVKSVSPYYLVHKLYLELFAENVIVARIVIVPFLVIFLMLVIIRLIVIVVPLTRVLNVNFISIIFPSWLFVNQPCDNVIEFLHLLLSLLAVLFKQHFSLLGDFFRYRRYSLVRFR